MSKAFSCALEEIVGLKKYLNRNDFKICSTAATGCTPSEMELEMLFEQHEVLPLRVVKAAVAEKVKNMDSEFYLMQVFRKLDPTRKNKFVIHVSHKN